jgi:hypothetical protein
MASLRAATRRAGGTSIDMTRRIKRMPGRSPPVTSDIFVVAAVAAIAIVTFLSGSAASAAGECLAAPNTEKTPDGSHWYYHVDHASGRKCWYAGPQAQQPRQAAAAPSHLRSSPKPAAQPPGAQDGGEPLAVPREPEVPAADTPSPAKGADTMEGNAQGSAPAGAASVGAASARGPDAAQSAASVDLAPGAPAMAPATPDARDDLEQGTEVERPSTAATAAAEPPQGGAVTPVQMVALLAAALAFAGIVVRTLVTVSAARRRVYVVRQGAWASPRPDRGTGRRNPAPHGSARTAQPRHPVGSDRMQLPASDAVYDTQQTLRQLLRVDSSAA